MRAGSRSERAYWAMILVLASVAALMAFHPEGLSLPGVAGEMPAPPPVMAAALFAVMLVVYGGLGFIGLRLAARVGFAGILDDSVSHTQRFGVPAAAGLLLAAGFILTDLLFAPLHGLGRIPHPPFPISLGASLTAGIGEEVLFRLFFISLWVWLVSHVLLRGRAQGRVFAAVTAVSALAFTVAHTPAVMYLMGLERVGDIPPALAVELFLLNGSLSVIAAVFLRSRGVLAAVGVHFWTDVGWHVLWGLVGGP
ncbi:MAG TPA: CPBP family glutamic-type intramembrane protease [Longimicrobiales bacterium]|nr:CPBP family glutamic-type intramembrane protease [Longimicrobiales bacterium]